MQLAHLATPHDTPPPLVSESIDFSISLGKLAHIHDPEGRRLFEGWAVLKGIDWQEDELSPESFEKSAQDYLARNPVILWDHARYLPIGRVLSLTISEEGVYVRGEILRGKEIAAQWAKEEKLDGKRFPAAQSIGAKCDEVWNLILQEVALGLSVSGSVRVWAAGYSPELGKYIRRSAEALIREISVTPTAVHPGARIVAANTFAKALEITKALELRPLPQPRKQRGKTMKLKKEELLAAQQKAKDLLAQYAEENDGEVPPEWVEENDKIQKALEFEGEDDTKGEPATGDPQDPPSDPAASQQQNQVPDVSDQIQKALEPIQKQNEQLLKELAELKGQPAPIKNRVTFNTPSSSQVKPTDLPSGGNKIQKALDTLKDPTKAEELPRHLPSDSMALFLLNNRKSFFLGNGMNVTPGMQRLVVAANQQQA